MRGMALGSGAAIRPRHRICQMGSNLTFAAQGTKVR